MNIESLEINILKASEIKDDDVVLVKIDQDTKSKLDKDTVQKLYKQITNMVKKEIPIYFFPSDISIEVLRKTVEAQEILNKNI